MHFPEILDIILYNVSVSETEQHKFQERNNKTPAVESINHATRIQT